MSPQRKVALAGLLAVALTLPGFVLVPPAPAVGTPAAEIVAYYQQWHRPFLVYGWLLGLSIPFHLAHLAGVSAWMASAGFCFQRTLYLAGALTAHTVQLLLLAVFQAIPYAALHLDAGATRLVSDLANIGFAFYALAEIPRLLAAALVIRRSRVVGRWLSAAAVLVAGLCLLGSTGAFLLEGPLAPGELLQATWYVAFLVWFTLLNLALWRRAAPRERDVAR